MNANRAYQGHGYVVQAIMRMGILGMFLGSMLLLIAGPIVWILLVVPMWKRARSKIIWSTLFLAGGYTFLGYDAQYNFGLGATTACLGLIAIGYCTLLIPVKNIPPQMNSLDQQSVVNMPLTLHQEAVAFEEDVARMFRLYGYNVQMTPRTGDHGIDMLLSKPPEYSIVQCKMQQANVGEPVVRDFYGAMTHEGATEGYLVTTADFTEQARQWARGKKIILIDRRVLKRMQYESKMIGHRPY